MRKRIFSTTVLLIALLSACNVQPQPIGSNKTNPQDVNAINGNTQSGRLGAQAVTQLFSEANLSTWSKAPEVSSLVYNSSTGFTKVNVATNFGWMNRIIPNSSATDTYTATIEAKGSGNVTFFFQKSGGDFIKYFTQTITLSSTVQTYTISFVKPADGFNIQVGLGSIPTTSNLEARNLNVKKGIPDNQLTNTSDLNSTSWVRNNVNVKDWDGNYSRVSNPTANNGWVNQRSTQTAAGRYKLAVDLRGSGSVKLIAQKGGGDFADYTSYVITLSNNAKNYQLVFDKPSDGFPIQFLISDVNLNELVWIRNPYLATTTNAVGTSSSVSGVSDSPKVDAPLSVPAEAKAPNTLSGKSAPFGMAPLSAAAWANQVTVAAQGGTPDFGFIFSGSDAGYVVPPYDNGPSSSLHSAVRTQLTPTSTSSLSGALFRGGTLKQDADYTFDFDTFIQSADYDFSGGSRIDFIDMNAGVNSLRLQLTANSIVAKFYDNQEATIFSGNYLGTKLRFRIEARFSTTSSGYVRISVNGVKQLLVGTSNQWNGVNATSSSLPLFCFLLSAPTTRITSITNPSPAITIFGDQLKIYSGVEDGTARDIFTQPFASNSIWNTPLASFTTVSDWPTAPVTFTESKIERNYIFKVQGAGADMLPMAPVLKDDSYNNWLINRCAMTSINSWNAQGKTYFYKIPVSGYVAKSNRNDAIGFLDLDSFTYSELNAACRTSNANMISAAAVYKSPADAGVTNISGSTFVDDNLKGEGIWGAQGGSAITAVGGAIRAGEIYSGKPIPHALKITLYARDYLYPGTRNSANITSQSQSSPTNLPVCNGVAYSKTRYAFSDDHRWPANNADGYAHALTAYGYKTSTNPNDPCDNSDVAHAYAGTNTAFQIGALLVITPSDYDLIISSLGTAGLTVTKQIARALRDYGAYVADDSFCTCVNIAMEGNLPANTLPNPDPTLFTDVHVVEQEMIDHTEYTAGQNGSVSATTPGKGGQYFSELTLIFGKLRVVNDNGPFTRGGLGVFRQGLPPKYIAGEPVR
jgi:hypothetical protein